VSSVPSQWVNKWASSGMAYLTGPPDGPPDFSRATLLARAERIAADAAGQRHEAARLDRFLEQGSAASG